MKKFVTFFTTVLLVTSQGIMSPTFGQWIPHDIDAEINRPVLLYAADIDGDGDLDLAAAGEQSDDVIWYENLGGTQISWTKHIIDENLDAAIGVYVADIDDDGDQDVAATGLTANDVVWYKNDLQNWTKNFIDQNLAGANDIITADLDGDENQDIIVTGFSANKVVWYNNLLGVAHAKLVQSYPRFIPTQGDTLVINAQLYNPENHPATVHAIINGQQYQFTDSLQLYDDGLHRDSLAADNIWGNSIWLSGMQEDIFIVDVTSYDIIEDIKYNLPSTPSFTTIGPVIFESYSITSTDTIPNHGNRLRFEINLKNNGTTATATDISIKVTELDTSCTDVIAFADPEYGDIAPGEVAEPSRGITISFLNDCPDSIDTDYKVDIYSGEYAFWSDTFSVFVIKDPTGLVNSKENIPLEFTLRQNYPNPFNPSTVISWQLAFGSDVELSVHNLLGQKLATLVSEEQKAGFHQVEFNAENLPSRIYFYKISAAEFTDVKKMILLR